MKRVLLVFSPQEDELRKELDHLLDSDDHLTYFATHEQRALFILDNDKPDIVIVGRSLATERGQVVQADGGLRLCEAIRGRSKVPLVLVVERLNPIQHRLNRLPAPVPVCFDVGPDLASSIQRHVRSMRLPPRWLEVILRVEDGTQWGYELRGVGFAYQENGDLALGQALIKNYRLTSKLLGSGADWRIAFEDFGQGMIDAFCEQNGKFRDDLKEGIRRAGGEITNTRVTFVVHPTNYGIALEALFAPRDYAPEPWMIHAPLLRNIAGAAPVHANLFEAEPTPLRVLLLCADTAGRVNNLPKPGGGVEKVDKLDSVRSECENLERFLKRLPKRMGIDDVVCEGLERPLTERGLCDVLSKGWDVVHFAGHSHCSDHGVASLIVNDPAGEPIAVDVQGVVKYLRRTRLLYMSSCRSGTGSFAVAAASQGIPSTIGFRWGVDDVYAELHARVFYRRLFCDKAIDQAFRSTRRAMHWYDQSNNAWASSMLVMGRA